MGSVCPERPLCVDLDGTLILGDTMRMCLQIAMKKKPLRLLLVPWWGVFGLATLKERISSGIELDPASLPYNRDFLAWLREEAGRGRELVLATATIERIALKISAHLGLFSRVVATSGKTNARGRMKAEKLVELFGEQGFDYAGNSFIDRHVWKKCHEAIIVNAPAWVENRCSNRERPVRIFSRSRI